MNKSNFNQKYFGGRHSVLGTDAKGNAINSDRETDEESEVSSLAVLLKGMSFTEFSPGGIGNINENGWQILP